MKFTVGSQQLSSRLSIISRVVPSSSKTGGTSAIINDILFEIKGGILRMTGTDGETRLTLSLRTQTHEGEDYTICIRPEHLLLPLKELPAQDLTFDIDTDNQHINVRYNNGHFDFVGQDASNYPDVAALEEQSTVLNLPTSVFSRGLTYTDYAVSVEDTRPLLGGVHIDISQEQISFAATDGYMMALYKNKSVQLTESPESKSFTLPGKPVSLIKLLFTHRSPGTTSDVESAEGATEETAPTLEDTIRVTVYANYATFEREDMRLQCRLLEGKYPNCESVIPQDNDKSIIADRSQLLAAFRRVSIFANDATKLINLVLTSNQLQLDAKDLGYSTSAQETLPVNYSGTEKFEIAFSALHLIKILSILPGDDVELLLGDRAHAAIITPQERDEDETIIAVDMPLLI